MELVETRQYFTMRSPSKRAVLMLVLPMSRVKIMDLPPDGPSARGKREVYRQGGIPFAKAMFQFRPLIRRSAIKMGVHSTAAAMASQVPAISAVPPIRLSTEAVSMPHNT